MKIINRIFSKISPRVKYSIGLSHILNLRPKYKKIKNLKIKDLF